MHVRVATWNVQWATPTSRRTPEILRRLEEFAPDVVCATEADNKLLSQDGHTICSQIDYGYRQMAGRRKVVLWSRETWEQVDDVGNDSLPPGRFVSGVTQTPLGEIAVVGICIPWSGSRVEPNRQLGRRKRWEDHEQYLAGLAEFLSRAPARRLIVMGDFNQTMGPGSRAPRNLRLALSETFQPKLSIVSSEVAFGGTKSIDHIVLSLDLVIDSIGAISNVHDGKKLSDHFGVSAILTGYDVP